MAMMTVEVYLKLDTKTNLLCRQEFRGNICVKQRAGSQSESDKMAAETNGFDDESGDSPRATC